MAMKGIQLLRGGSFGFGHSETLYRQAWLFLVLWALSPYSVERAAAAKVCTTNADGKTVCHDKLSGGAIAAIVITVVLVLLLCAGIYYFVRRARVHRVNATLSTNFVIPALGYNTRSRRRDEEEGDSDDSDDEKYLSVEKNQVHGPAWEARYDPSSAPLPGKGFSSGGGGGSSSWSSRLRSIKSGGSHSGTEEFGRHHQPMSAPGFGGGGYGRSIGGHGYHAPSSSSSSSAVKKPRSAGAEPSMSMVSKGKRHWGSLIHGSQSKNGSRSAGSAAVIGSGGSMTSSHSNPELPTAPAKQFRSRASPGLQIIAESHGYGHSGFHNAPVIPPITPHTPRTPSNLGTAPPLSAGPVGAGFSSAPIPLRTPRTAGTTTPLTPRPPPAYSPVTPRGPIGAI
ncbi:hypothetical protein GYMLUDRAFT_39575 [Collybiopsis luxurians FD-317 M1]|nr:hypothetical protein GYMLUDRAFT_39575 [Collybiopsis luxurians FD-317 M1]